MSYRIHRLAPIVAAAGDDTDAQAFFTAAGITDSTQKSAVNQLVLDLKSASIWTKMTALYPFVGGDATKHSYNLKNPATFQITWNGTVTHDANGITGNGTTGYGNTGVTPSTHLTEDNTHIGLYCRTSAAETGTMRDMGCIDGSNNSLYLNLSRSSQFQGFCYSTTNINVANSNPQGFYLISRRSNTDFAGFKNGSNVMSSALADSFTRPSQAIYISARNSSGTVSSFTNRNYALASIGSGLTDTDASNFSTAVATFQTTLSRNV